MCNFQLFTVILCGCFFVNNASLFKGLLEHKEDPTDFAEGDHFHAYDNRENKVEDVHLRFYNGKTTGENVDIKLTNAAQLLNENHFNKKNPTVFYAHGYKETPESESVQVVVSAYLESQPDTNVVLIDWSNMAFGTYHVNAAPNTKLVGEAVALAIKKLVDGDLNLQGIHLVGHSLGGQVVGTIGRNLQLHNVKLQRISALDPAFPLFYPGFVLSHISSSDAQFVDIIHTAAGTYGAPVHTGTADFWPNGGVAEQPGCTSSIIPLSPEDLCSHWRSWRFWAESLKNPKGFPAVHSSSFASFKKDSSAHKGSVVYMGINADKSAAGDFFLHTNAQSPFAKGDVGIQRK